MDSSGMALRSPERTTKDASQEEWRGSQKKKSSWENEGWDDEGWDDKDEGWDEDWGEG